MSITKLTPVWIAQTRAATHDHVRHYVPPPRVIIGLLTGDGEHATREQQRHRER